MKRGCFITFEGGEGCGKSTQISLLNDALNAIGQTTIKTREPGGTSEGEELRALLSHQEHGKQWKPMAELLLISAARVQHVEKLIIPSLNEGKFVISDRYTDSTRVYQGYLQKLDEDFLENVINKSTTGLEPDLTFILDLPAQEGLERVKKRGIRDHYDEQDEGFYSHIRDGFLSIAEKFKQRCVVIDARQSIDSIALEILRHTQERLIRA